MSTPSFICIHSLAEVKECKEKGKKGRDGKGEDEKKNQKDKARTMPLGNSMVQRRLSGIVGRVQRAAVLEQQVDHRHRADCRRPVQRVLAALVAHAGRRRRRVLLEQLARQVQVGFGGYKVQRRLFCCFCLVGCFG